MLEEPNQGMARTIGIIRGLMVEAGIGSPFRMSAALSNGQELIAYRWSSDGRSPTLYTACDRTIGSCIGERDSLNDATILLSEPLDDAQESWGEIGDGKMLHATAASLIHYLFPRMA